MAWLPKIRDWTKNAQPISKHYQLSVSQSRCGCSTLLRRLLTAHKCRYAWISCTEACESGESSVPSTLRLTRQRATYRSWSRLGRSRPTWRLRYRSALTNVRQAVRILRRTVGFCSEMYADICLRGHDVRFRVDRVGARNSATEGSRFKLRISRTWRHRNAAPLVNGVAGVETWHVLLVHRGTILG